jgi:hypothetical protein
MRAALLVPLLLASPALAWADPAEGRKLVEDRKCEACHQAKTPSDAKAVYLRKDRKVTSWAKLKSQVALCNTELNLSLFPDEEESIAAFLNAEYYRFTVDR